MTKSRATLRRTDLIFIVTVTCLAFALRLCALTDVPPGWRDDELINIHTLSGELLDGRFPLYFTGASGHEPLYHYLHAGLSALSGYNVPSGHLLSVFFGTLTIPLMFVLVRRLFDSLVAALTTLALTTSFWSLMYSRIALRHISLPAFALVAFYLFWVPLASHRRPVIRWALPLGLVLGLSLYTYPVARLLPVVLVCFSLYLTLWHRDMFRHSWTGYALALMIAVVVAIPLALTVAQGYGEAAAQGIGADARLAELSRPIRALQDGDPGLLLDTVWITLNMFHATGDPEALYNIPNRPVFNIVGAGLFWAGLLICLFRWRQPRYFFLILWLSFGLLPTVLSVPPASLSHSILVQPLAYLLPVLALVWGYRRLQRRFAPRLDQTFSLPLLVTVLFVFLLPTAYRDLWDYFQKWPQRSYVRFLYRADYREAARYLDSQSETQDWAVGSLLMGPWDRLALNVDAQRSDLAVRLFNPQRALVYVKSTPSSPVLLTSYPLPSPSIERLLRKGTQSHSSLSVSGLTYYRLESPFSLNQEQSLGQFANGLNLVAIAWGQSGPPAPGREALLLTAWTVAAPLRLPPLPIIANPPPPGVYLGPRLAVFAHILAADSSFLSGDDGLWVDPLTLRPGDHFIQVHRFTLPSDAPDGPYVLEMGLYDPFTKERWTNWSAAAPSGSDRLLFAVEKVPLSLDN